MDEFFVFSFAIVLFCEIIIIIFSWSTLKNEVHFLEGILTYLLRAELLCKKTYERNDIL